MEWAGVRQDELIKSIDACRGNNRESVLRGDGIERRCRGKRKEIFLNIPAGTGIFRKRFVAFMLVGLPADYEDLHGIPGNWGTFCALLLHAVRHDNPGTWESGRV